MNATNCNPKYLNQKQLAARWGVARTTLYAWIKSGRKMPRASFPGDCSRPRYAIEDVEAYEAEVKRPGIR